MIPKVNFIQIHHSGEIIAIKEQLMCKTENVIYVAECTICHMQLIGSTTRPLKERVREYKSNSRRKVRLS